MLTQHGLFTAIKGRQLFHEQLDGIIQPVTFLQPRILILTTGLTGLIHILIGLVIRPEQ